MKIGLDRAVPTLFAVFALTVCGWVLSVTLAQAQETSCANEVARGEQPYGLELPDCRAYEMVSPLNKDDNNVAENSARSSVTGDAVTYISRGAFAEPKAALNLNRYVSRRGASGWLTQNITPPYKSYETNLLEPYQSLQFTPDLSKGLARTYYSPLTSDTPAGYANYYVADIVAGSYQGVTSITPPGLVPYEQTAIEQPDSGGASADLSHVAFEEYGPEGLVPGASPNHTHVFEWVGGRLTQVDIAPEGMTLEAEGGIGAPGGQEGTSGGDVWRAVSADGSRVFFTGGEATGPEHGRELVGQVYVREADRERTIEVSASQKTNGKGPRGTDEDGPKPARYWGASTDGSRVFFTSVSELTDDANTGPADNASNLYEYDLETGVLSDLTVDVNAGDVNGAAVLGLVTASEDGSYVYFVAEGILAEGAVSAKPNLYLYHAGKVTFVASLAPATKIDSETELEGGGDSQDWFGDRPHPGANPYGSWGPSSHTVRVSPDGIHLAFVSELSLTSYDNEPIEPSFGCRSGRCPEVYLYDAKTSGLACASCDPNGSRPIGRAKLGGNEEAGPESTSATSPFYIPLNLSDDGGRLFFQSPDALVPHDSNGRQDVYEYEDGHVYPISNVAGNFDSDFLDASPNGTDVFVTTGDQLLPSDTDQRVDLYDVRAGGGFPVSAAPPDCDNGDSCKPPVSPQPGVFGAPASATFSGAGNVTPVATLKPVLKARAKAKRCKKGFVRKRGRCVRKAKKSGGHSKRGRK
jgi:hypothetical protein